jgi:hypothetical protein
MEKHLIKSPKLRPTFVCNLHGFQVVDAIFEYIHFFAACHAKNENGKVAMTYLRVIVL